MSFTQTICLLDPICSQPYPRLLKDSRITSLGKTQKKKKKSSHSTTTGFINLSAHIKKGSDHNAAKPEDFFELWGKTMSVPVKLGAVDPP